MNLNIYLGMLRQAENTLADSNWRHMVLRPKDRTPESH